MAKPNNRINFQAIKSEAKRILQQSGRNFERTMVTKHLSGPTGPNSLSRRTGAGARSIKTVVVDQGNSLKLVGFIDSQGRHLIPHEKGATITPKRAQKLAIPLRAARTNAGVSRVTSPRQWPTPLRVAKSKRGSLLLVESKLPPRKKGGARRPGPRRTIPVLPGEKPIYVLKDRVTLPPRLNFRREFEIEAVKAQQRLRALVGKFKKGR